MTEGGRQTIDMGANMETEEGLAIIDALNEVSDVQAMAGPEVTFTGEKKASLGPVGRLQGVEVFACPRGWFVLLREPAGPHWCVAGHDLAAALSEIHEEELREGVAKGLESRGWL